MIFPDYIRRSDEQLDRMDEIDRRWQLAWWNGKPNQAQPPCFCCPYTWRPRTDARATRPT